MDHKIGTQFRFVNAPCVCLSELSSTIHTWKIRYNGRCDQWTSLCCDDKDILSCVVCVWRYYFEIHNLLNREMSMRANDIVSLSKKRFFNTGYIWYCLYHAATVLHACFFGTLHNVILWNFDHKSIKKLMKNTRYYTMSTKLRKIATMYMYIVHSNMSKIHYCPSLANPRCKTNTVNS